MLNERRCLKTQVVEYPNLNFSVETSLLIIDHKVCDSRPDSRPDSLPGSYISPQ